MILATIVAVAAGVWRLAKGKGLPSIPGVLRNAIGVIIGLAAGYLSGLPLYVGLPIGAVAAMNLVVGYSDWMDLKKNTIRYAVPTLACAAVLFAVPGLVFNPIVAVAFGLSGAVFGAMQHFAIVANPSVPKFLIVDNIGDCVAFVQGLTLIGLVGFLNG